MIRITKRFCFEAAHMLHGHDGKCKNLHGHSYKLEVTVIGNPISDSNSPKLGMVMDFGDLKKIIQTEIIDIFDHATVICKNTPHDALTKELTNANQQVVLVDYQPTSENMLIDFAKKIKPKLPNNIRLFKLKLQETETAFAEWFADDNC